MLVFLQPLLPNPNPNIQKLFLFPNRKLKLLNLSEPFFRGGRGRSFRERFRGGYKGGRSTSTRGRGKFYLNPVLNLPFLAFDNRIINQKIHCLTGYDLDETTVKLLSLGLNFIPNLNTNVLKNVFGSMKDFKNNLNTKMYFWYLGKNEQKQNPDLQFSSKKETYNPKFKSLNKWVCDESYTCVERFCDDLHIEMANKIEEFMSNHKGEDIHKFNLSNKLIKKLLFLKKRKNKMFLISDTDKNVGLVVIDVEKNKKECWRQLRDAKTYQSLSKKEIFDVKETALSSLEAILDKYSEMCTHQEKRFLKTHVKSFKIPHFYVLWKMHKNPIVGRPIVAGYSWIATSASKFVTFYLKDFVTKFETILPDSIHLVRILETTKFERDCWLFAADIRSLYTNIDVDDAIEVHKKIFEKYPHEKADLIIELLEFVLKNNLMEFCGEIYLQIFGIAMGTPVAPVLANLYLAVLEVKLKELMKNDPKFKWPILFKRFIDDGFGVLNGDLEDVKYFVKCFNSLTKTIVLDITYEGNYVVFMDLVIFKGKRFTECNLLDIKVYQKELNIYSYIPFTSEHPAHVHYNFIKGEIKRYIRFNSNEVYFWQIIEKFFMRLRNRGYSRLFLCKIFAEIDYSCR